MLGVAALIGIALAALLAHESIAPLLGASLDGDQLTVLRRIVTADPAVERGLAIVSAPTNRRPGTQG